MIVVHTLVKNESRFLWFSVMSVIDHVDQIKIWDTGSTDGSLEIISEINKNPNSKDKILFKTFDSDSFSEEKVRQKMLEKTSADWFIILDADEIWWEDSIKKLTDFIKEKGSSFESIVVPTINVVGDIFHYQEESGGKYRFGNLKGHYNLRAINRKIPGLRCSGEHGQLGYVDSDNKMIQYRNRSRIKFLQAPYLHCTYLQRSSSIDGDKEVYKRSKKRKHELGISFPPDYFFPEVFFRPRPRFVPSPWGTMDFKFRFVSFFETPFRKIHRRYFPEKVGY